MIDYGWREEETQRVESLVPVIAEWRCEPAAGVRRLGGQGVLAAGRRGPGGDGSRGAVLAGLVETLARHAPALWVVAEAHMAALAALDALASPLAEAATTGDDAWAWAHEDHRGPGTDGRTTLQADGDGWRLTGQKAALPLGAGTRYLLVSARLGDESALLVVPGESAGITWHAQRLGAAPTLDAARPEFDLRLPAGALAARGTDAERAIRRAAGRAALGGAAGGLGLVETALAVAQDYAMGTIVDGRKLAVRQHIHFAIADIKVDADSIRRTLGKAADRWAGGHADGDDLIAVARCFAGRQVPAALQRSAEVLGTFGLDDDHPLSHARRAAALVAVAGGSTESWIEHLAAGSLNALR